jgi:NADH-quinone oxidoreductase subunit G
LQEIAAGVAGGTIKSLLVLGEDALECGISEDDLKKLDSLVVTAILPDKTTANATVLLPAASWAEKRGSMINVKGRLQRLNRAISSPGKARDDWEILHDLIQTVSGSNGTYSIDELFKQIAAEFRALEGLSLSRIGDLGLDLSGKLEVANT